MSTKTVYLFANVCVMFVHAFFTRRVHAQCLDYVRNNVWNAIILEAVPWNQRFLNLQVECPETETELYFVVTLCYTAVCHVPARQVWCLFMVLLHLVNAVNRRQRKCVVIVDIMAKVPVSHPLRQLWICSFFASYNTIPEAVTGTGLAYSLVALCWSTVHPCFGAIVEWRHPTKAFTSLKANTRNSLENLFPELFTVHALSLTGSGDIILMCSGRPYVQLRLYLTGDKVIGYSKVIGLSSLHTNT